MMMVMMMLAMVMMSWRKVRVQSPALWIQTCVRKQNALGQTTRKGEARGAIESGRTLRVYDSC